MEKTYKAPNFYSTETDLSVVTPTTPSGTPAVIIGAAPRGPAYVPVTVANNDDFVGTFGELNKKYPATFAAKEYFKNSSAMTFIRLLGAGANSSTNDIATTQTTDRVRSAGFKFEGVTAPNDGYSRHAGCVQFLVAQHALQAAEAAEYPLFTRCTSFTTSSGVVNLVRAMIFTASGSRVMVLDGDESVAAAFTAYPDDVCLVKTGSFKLVISSSDGTAFGSADGMAGLRVYSASLDPSSQNYVGKLLNTNPAKFSTEQHVLWADFAVDAELASASTVAVVSGSANTAANAAEASLSYRRAFGGFDTRFKTPSTTWFISQPFGGVEYDLFRIESIDDGVAANTAYKITIRDLQASTDDSNPYGYFTIQVRTWDDTDLDPRVLEQFSRCSLDPTSDRYVAKLIGDRKVSMNFDSTLSSERRLAVSGKYENVSQRIRIVMSDATEAATIPKKSLPFGFRGVSVLKTTDSLTDSAPSSAAKRITGYLSSSVGAALSGAIVPPIPFRQKLTRGLTPTSPAWLGQPASSETVLPLLTWGVKFERNNSPYNANITSEQNKMIEAVTKFVGIAKLDVLVTGSGADQFCNNKFTLANVALSNSAVTDVTASADVHMLEAAYWRDARLDQTDLRVTDSTLGKRITLGTLLTTATAQLFNKFSNFAKFTTLLVGGFDGLNVMDTEDAVMSDKASSFDALGGASSGYVPTGFATSQAGSGTTNNIVVSTKYAIDIATDPVSVDANVLAIPGIREPYIIDYATQKAKINAALFCVLDIPPYASDGTRLYASSTQRQSVDKTASQFAARAIDNSYAAAYFPDVFIRDDFDIASRVPATVAVLGVIALNDKVAFPWYAPAGYNRAVLPMITNAVIRMSETDRDKLSDVRINPISNSADSGWAITGQKTLQMKRSSLDRINVRRMLVEVKRQIIKAALKVMFEQNDASTRAALKKTIEEKLGFVKAQSGIDSFIVRIDESNNTQDDIDLNKMNCAIAVVPVRSVEYVVIDFIVTRSGVTFV